MSLHPSTFEYLQPTPTQLDKMNALRGISRAYAFQLETMLPEGADKTYILRRVRETAMWINIAITREADGAPRT